MSTPSKSKILEVRFPAPLGEPVQVTATEAGGLLYGHIIQYAIDESGSYICVRFSSVYHLEDEWYPVHEWGSKIGPSKP